MNMVYVARNVAACIDRNNNKQKYKNMDTFDKIEAMLAELLEQANDQKKNSGKLSSKLDGIDDRLSNLEAVSASPQVTESVITLVDHDKKMGEVQGQLQKWYSCYENYKQLYEKLIT